MKSRYQFRSRLVSFDVKNWFKKLESELVSKKVACRTLRANGDITVDHVQDFCKRLNLGLRVLPNGSSHRLIVAVDHGRVS